MDYLAVKAFFKGLADANGWGFAHNSEHLEEKKGSEKAWDGKLILVMDEPRGRTRYNGSWFDLPSYGFWLLRKTEKGDWESEDVIYQEAKTAYEVLILGAIADDLENESGLFSHLDGDSMDYRKAGPLTANRYFGLYVGVGATDTIDMS